MLPCDFVHTIPLRGVVRCMHLPLKHVRVRVDFALMMPSRGAVPYIRVSPYYMCESVVVVPYVHIRVSPRIGYC
jgi:hypothetical protein